MKYSANKEINKLVKSLIKQGWSCSGQVNLATV